MYKTSYKNLVHNMKQNPLNPFSNKLHL